MVDFIIVRKIFKPGQVYWEDDQTLFGYNDKPYTGKATTYSTIIYTDYTSLEVRFICTELRHYWYTEAKIRYYISTKDRKFDSVSKVGPQIDRLRELGSDLNRMLFLKNDVSCAN